MHLMKLDNVHQRTHPSLKKKKKKSTDIQHVPFAGLPRDDVLDCTNVLGNFINSHASALFNLD